MATRVAPRPTAKSNGTSPSSFGDLGWLDTEHAIYKKNKNIWTREERRHLVGLDGVLQELARWDGESDDSYNIIRKAWAKNVPFGKTHVTAITGELSRKRPMPGKGLSFGGLGDIRARDAIDVPNMAELAYYNWDGVGQDGSEFPAWMDDVDIRAQVTGHRWLMIESPVSDGTAISLAQWQAGVRPWAVEYLHEVRNWLFVRGALQFAVLRVPTEEPSVQLGALTNPSEKPGYYVLVREGFAGLGSVFARGGWWLFDDQKAFTGRTGVWPRTPGGVGEIPMCVHYGERATGTKDFPMMSRSSTAGFGQIEIALMNITSARDGNFWDACSPLTMLLGADGKITKTAVDQILERSILIGVPFPRDAKGNAIPMTVHEASMAAVPAEVAKAIVDAKFQEAREESFQKITSTPDSSGASKEAGHAENKAPVLARRARYRQQTEQTLIRFFELRSGIQKPSGVSTWTTDFDLAPLVDAIDAAFATLRSTPSKLTSRTAEIDMVLTSLAEHGIVNDANRAKIRSELEASFDQGQADAAAQRKLLADAGSGGFGGGT